MEKWDVPVSGLSCDRCVQTVTEQIGGLDGVASVRVEEHLGGVSTVHVEGERVLDDAVLQDALQHGGAFTITR